MTILLDANVLIAIGWSHHEHHAVARRWFRQHQGRGWATTPVTQAAFIRVSSHLGRIPGARPVPEIVEALRKLLSLSHHHFWPDDVELARTPYFAASKIRGHRQVTDAHLVALALRHGGQIATFDRGLREIVPDSHSPESVVILLSPHQLLAPHRSQ